MPTATCLNWQKRSVSVASNNVKALIGQYEHIITDWDVDRLKLNKGFMHASRSYPEFAKWALDKRPDLKAQPLSEPKKAVATPNVALLQPTDADLPPPCPFKKRFREIKEFKENVWKSKDFI